jgi:membrane-bound lytic murein transglycosylase B
VITRRSLLAAASVAALGSHAASAAAGAHDWNSFIQGVRQEAAGSGIRGATLDRSLGGLQPIARVLELDRKQPERTFTFDQYLERVVNQARIDTARRKLAENRALLDEVASRFGVQPRFIVALWGIETDFGRITGNFHVIGALATLAYDGRRSAFFRKELLNALKIVDQGHVRPEAMLGSWAGAMGQSQFMPSSFLSYAVDWDGDGRRDIWSSRGDVLASIANYLSKIGWRGDQTWGREVRLPRSLDHGHVGLEVRRPLDFWSRAGVRRADGGELPSAREVEASVIQPGGADSRALLVYDNFRSVMKWNNSTYFASAVGYLADGIESP